MSDTDLRPTPGDGYRPEPVAPASRKWWQTLKARIGILVLIALLGLGYGVYRGVRQNLPHPMSLLPESQRPAREQAMRRAIDAFYANPTAETGQAAWDAIFAYRRTFPDADLNTGVEESAKIVCADNLRECDLKKEQALQRQTILISEIAAKHSRSFAISSSEFNRNVVLDEVMDRRIAEASPTGTIGEYLKRIGREKKLAELRNRFFADIDKAASAYTVNKDPSVSGSLREYLKIYANEAKDTLKEIAYGECPIPQRGYKDGELCDAARRKIAMAYRSDQATRVAVAKEVITERQAPMQALEQAITQIFR